MGSEKLPEIECLNCGGYLHKNSVSVATPFRCVRCGQEFSDKEIENQFKKEHLESSKSLRDNIEIKKILKKELF